jgi:hypothetical protein
MPIRLVFDYPGRQITSTIGRWFARLIGSVLALTGLLATIVVVPTGLVTIGDVLATLNHEQVFEPGFPVREVEAGFAASLVVAIAGLKYGRRLVRGRRSSVLFLRRFGFDGSMQVVTYAVANSVGARWRLVTLDDEEIAPVGVSTMSRLFFGAGERLTWLARTIGSGILVGFQWTTGAMWGVVAIQAAVIGINGSWRRALIDGTVDRYARIFSSIMERHIPVKYFDVSLPGAFAVLATAAGFLFIGLIVVFAALIALLPLIGVVVFASSSDEALRKAEKAKTATITQASHIDDAVRDISHRGRETFAPRLVVLRVKSSIWQPTVTALANVASATLLDISELTENMAWELGELQRLGALDRCIFIAENDRIARWADGGPGATPLQSQVAAVIGDCAVLTYATNRKGMRRFARALYGMLLDIPADGATGHAMRNVVPRPSA